MYKIKECTQNSQELTINDWLIISKECAQSWVERIISQEGFEDNNIQGREVDKEFKGCMASFKMKYLDQKRLDSLKKINEGVASEKTLREYTAIVKEINQLKPMLGNLDA